MNTLFHGSKVQGIKKLLPKESGHKTGFVYAVSEEAFATIFIRRPGGSLVATWGRLKGIPYYCERKRGVFNKNYSKKKGSIYVVDKSYFKQKKSLWKEELVSNKEVPIIKEIKIPDLKKHMLDLEKQNKLKIIYYKDRLKYFPKLDEQLLETCIDLIKKYGKEKTIANIKKYQPKILKKLS